MTFNDKKQIILSYIDADIAGTIPTGPAFIPGVGQTPSVRGLADDTFRIIAEHYRKPIGQAMIIQLGHINTHLRM